MISYQSLSSTKRLVNQTDIARKAKVMIKTPTAFDMDMCPPSSCVGIDFVGAAWEGGTAVIIPCLRPLQDSGKVTRTIKPTT
jgi:hypothetical protein